MVDLMEGKRGSPWYYYQFVMSSLFAKFLCRLPPIMKNVNVFLDRELCDYLHFRDSENNNKNNTKKTLS